MSGAATDERGARRPDRPPARPAEWVDVCALADLVPEWGVAALVGEAQVAIFLLAGPGIELRAVGHRDPFTGANVIARGLVGSAGDRTYVASPLHKQRFDLSTGECLDVPDVRIPSFRVREAAGRVLVASATPG